MQVLNASPRDAHTVKEIHDLLTGNRIVYKAGLDLLDGSNNLVADISSRLVSGSVDRVNTAVVHGTCKLRIEGELAWGKDRVRPWLDITNSDDSITARFYLGVFVLTTPNRVLEESPLCYDVVGFDLINLLQSSIDDTYAVSAGTTYLGAVQTLLAASGIGATVALDGTLSATTLPVDMVWAMNPTEDYTWIRVANDLLAAINYVALWADEKGILHSGPYVAPINRGIEWVFDTSDQGTDLVAPRRTLTSDVWGAKNRWRFVRKAMATKPVVGSGIYQVDNVSTGRTSQTALGRIVRATPVWLDAADQTSLVAQGDRLVAANQAISRSFDISVDALPVAGHFDVVQFIDGGDSDKCQVINWSVPLDGSPGKWTLEAVTP